MVCFPFDVNIFTDSEYSIIVINKIMNGDMLRCNMDLLLRLKNALNLCNSRITINKCKAHSGILPNEAADWLSKVGSGLV